MSKMITGHDGIAVRTQVRNTAGLALIVLGTAIVAIAATRFLVTVKNIDSGDLRHGAGSRIDVALPALLVGRPISLGTRRRMSRSISAVSKVSPSFGGCCLLRCFRQPGGMGCPVFCGWAMSRRRTKRCDGEGRGGIQGAG
jgi:hypothetical protein